MAFSSGKNTLNLPVPNTPILQYNNVQRDAGQKLRRDIRPGRTCEQSQWFRALAPPLNRKSYFASRDLDRDLPAHQVQPCSPSALSRMAINETYECTPLRTY